MEGGERAIAYCLLGGLGAEAAGALDEGAVELRGRVALALRERDPHVLACCCCSEISCDSGIRDWQWFLFRD